MTNSPFARAIAAIATPFDADLGIDFDRLAAHGRWLFERGCDGLVLFGTTGEAASLSSAERQSALERLVAAGISADRIVVGTGCCAIPDTVELTRHAAVTGCAGALVLPPFFYKGVSDEGVARYYDCVIAKCGTSLPPLYLYHIPQTAGVGVAPGVVERLVARHGPKIRGYKDSSGNWSNTASILERFPQLDVYVGSEALLVETLRAGGAGCISASVNVQPSAVRAVLDGWRSREADALQAVASAVRRALEKSGPLVSAVKAVLAAIHRHDGWTTTRPPLEAIGQAERENLFAELRGVGLEGL